MNDVLIIGVVKDEPVFSHENLGEKFYRFIIETTRLSNTTDKIPVLISEKLLGCVNLYKDAVVKLAGQYRSYNQHFEDKVKLLLNIFVDAIENTDEPDYDEIQLQGYLCKPVIYRKTPLGREIADICMAIPRNYGKSDYIPCICWGRNAKFVKDFDVGTEIFVTGRIQSRNYKKRISDDESEIKTAYEVSVTRIDLVE